MKGSKAVLLDTVDGELTPTSHRVTNHDEDTDRGRLACKTP
jgi:hypothetical protein